MNFFAKSLLLEMPQENLIRRLQGFVILAVSGAKPLHCGNEYIVIAALTFVFQYFSISSLQRSNSEQGL